MPGLRVFISYRRNDAPAHAQLLRDGLSDRFGDDNVFMDIDNIGLGEDFVEAIDKAVASCDVLVAVIGPRWLAAVDAKGNRRIDEPGDFVRLEIGTALGRDIRVVPALVGGAELPRSEELPPELNRLPRRNAVKMEDGPRWRDDVARVVRSLEHDPAAAPRGSTVADGVRHGSGRRKIAAAIAIVLLTGLGAFAFNRYAGSGPTPKMATSAIVNELLLPHVPEATRPECTIVPPADSSVFLRSVRCPQASSTYTVTYNKAHSGPDLRAFFDAAEHQELTSCGTDECFPSGTCTARAGADAAGDAWYRVGSIAHAEKAANGAPQSHADGRVLCYVTDDKAWIEWTDAPTKIYATASRPVAQWPQLLAWWRSASGPDKNQAMHAGGMPSTQWPDDLETELLLAHVPGSSATRCSRVLPAMNDGLIRSVRCPQAGTTGFTATYSYAHDVDALRTYYPQHLQAMGQAGPSTMPSTACSPDAFTGESWWTPTGDRGHITTLHVSGMVRGRVSCYVDDGGHPTIEWYDSGALIYVVAQRPRMADWPALFRWWQAIAGPTTTMHDAGGMSATPPTVTSMPSTVTTGAMG